MEQERIVWRRCFVAVLRDIRHSLLFVITTAIFTVMITIKVFLPYLRYATITPITVAFLMAFYTIPPIAIIIFALDLRDATDEKYEITENGKIRILYRKWATFYSPRSGDVSRVDTGYIIKDGFLANALNYGDVFLQVGWSKTPFKITEVKNPQKVLETILDRANAPSADEGESALGNIMYG